MRRPNGKHPVPCTVCGGGTYRASALCQRCEQADGSALPKPEAVPESYLMRCAEELLRRHKVRAEALEKLGMFTGRETA